MKEKNLFLLAVIVIIILLLFVLLSVKSMLQTTFSPQTNSQEKIQTFQIQESNKRDVTVEVTPLSLGVGKEAIFQLKFDTHSVELEYELTKISKLKDDQGNIYQALSWDGGKGGHHLSGKLIFPKISDQAKSVTLIIANIENEDRIFTWDI